MRRLLLFFIGVFLAGLPPLHAEDGLTLAACYHLALDRSETVAIHREQIRETEGQVHQAMATAMPTVGFVYAESWQDAGNRNGWHDSREEARFTFSQPLFTGFKEIAAIRASKHLGRQRELELARAREMLLTDVSDAFFLYLGVQKDEAAAREIIAALKDQKAELARREAIGRSRPSETAGAEARLSRAEAGLEGVAARRAAAKLLLEFLIGRDPGQLVEEPLPAETPSLEELAAGVEQRADIVAAKENLAVSRNGIIAARSLFYPSLALNANSYTKRKGDAEGGDWDVMLVATVPVFNGLNTVGQVREARARSAQADLALSLALRRARLEVRDAYARWQGNARSAAALEKAVAAAGRNYRLQLEDFNHSLVSNLDVLQAIADLEGVRRELIAAQADEQRAYWALRTAAGGAAL